jgi:hypothetical protein
MTRTSLFLRSDAILATLIFLFRDIASIAQSLIPCELGWARAVLPSCVHGGVIQHKVTMKGSSLADLEQRYEHDQQKDSDA